MNLKQRLIDVDKLSFEKYKRNAEYIAMLEKSMQQAREGGFIETTAEAIPIEWVIELSNKLKNDEDDFEKSMFLLDLVDLWEKENEKRIMSDM